MHGLLGAVAVEAAEMDTGSGHEPVSTVDQEMTDAVAPKTKNRLALLRWVEK